jgi:hypothetical protein
MIRVRTFGYFAENMSYTRGVTLQQIIWNHKPKGESEEESISNCKQTLKRL